MKDYLPEFNGIDKELRKGRSVYGGYQRGWGLQFGELSKAVQKDPLYREALNVAKGRTILMEHNRMNLYLIMKFYLSKLTPGHIIEFGAYLGGNAIFMAYIAKELYPDMRIYALDTFEGMPKVDQSIDAHKEGDFSDINLDELKAYVKKIGLDNLEFRKGLFQDTTEEVLAEAGNIQLAHIDCDIYESVLYSYDLVKSRMVNGGYMIFDDANVSSCIGATEAVEDFVIKRDGHNSEQIYPHFVFRNFK